MCMLANEVKQLKSEIEKLRLKTEIMVEKEIDSSNH